MTNTNDNAVELLDSLRKDAYETVYRLKCLLEIEVKRYHPKTEEKEQYWVFYKKQNNL